MQNFLILLSCKINIGDCALCREMQITSLDYLQWHKMFDLAEHLSPTGQKAWQVIERGFECWVLSHLQLYQASQLHLSEARAKSSRWISTFHHNITSWTHCSNLQFQYQGKFMVRTQRILLPSNQLFILFHFLGSNIIGLLPSRSDVHTLRCVYISISMSLPHMQLSLVNILWI